VIQAVGAAVSSISETPNPARVPGEPVRFGGRGPVPQGFDNRKNGILKSFTR
jgi:hypothetical protein